MAERSSPQVLCIRAANIVNVLYVHAYLIPYKGPSGFVERREQVVKYP